VGRGATLVSFLILVTAAGLLTEPVPQTPIPVGQGAIIDCFSPAGRFLATHEHEPGGSFFQVSGPVRVWDASSGELSCAVADGWSDVSRVQFSPDSRWLLAAEKGHHWRMWDASTGELGADLDLETRFGNHVGTRFTPNGKFLLLQQRSYDDSPERVQFWDVEARSVCGSIEGYIWSVAFAVDNKTLAICDRDPASPVVKIGVWRLGGEDTFATSLRRHDVRADTVTFSPRWKHSP
jgi:WD40 repeat protein